MIVSTGPLAHDEIGVGAPLLVVPGASIAIRYALRYPEHVRSLGFAPDPEQLRSAASARSGVVVQPEAGHHPWLDDAEFFRKAIADFLDD